jgi:hypothetical protein
MSSGILYIEKDLNGSFPGAVQQGPWIWKIEQDPITKYYRIRYSNENCCRQQHMTKSLCSLEALLMEFRAGILSNEKCPYCLPAQYIPFQDWDPLSKNPVAVIPLDYPILSLYTK